MNRQPGEGRKDLTVSGTPAKGGRSRKIAKREREPWLLVASPELDLSARQIVTRYSRRMQIELAFRDLKSHRYGQGFEDSLTRKPKRLEILLLIHALATFATWLVGQACEASGLDAWLAPRKSARRLYSLVRLGCEALVRRWHTPNLSSLIESLRHPTSDLLDQLGSPA